MDRLRHVPVRLRSYAGDTARHRQVTDRGRLVHLRASAPYPTEDDQIPELGPVRRSPGRSPEFDVSRVYESMTVLSNGTVLLAGGQTFNNKLGAPCRDCARALHS